ARGRPPQRARRLPPSPVSPCRDTPDGAEVGMSGGEIALQMALAQTIHETADALGVAPTALARWLTTENRLTRILYALVGGFSSADALTENQTILREYVSFLDEQSESILPVGEPDARERTPA